MSELIERVYREQRESAKFCCAICRRHAWGWSDHYLHTCSPGFVERMEQHAELFRDAVERREPNRHRRLTDWRTDPRAYRRRWQD